MKFKYIIINEDYTIYGTNDESLITDDQKQFTIVLDVEAGQELSFGETPYDIDELKKG